MLPDLGGGIHQVLAGEEQAPGWRAIPRPARPAVDFVFRRVGQGLGCVALEIINRDGSPTQQCFHILPAAGSLRAGSGAKRGIGQPQTIRRPGGFKDHLVFAGQVARWSTGGYVQQGQALVFQGKARAAFGQRQQSGLDRVPGVGFWGVQHKNAQGKRFFGPGVQAVQLQTVDRSRKNIDPCYKTLTRSTWGCRAGCPAPGSRLCENPGWRAHHCRPLIRSAHLAHFAASRRRCPFRN